MKADQVPLQNALGQRRARDLVLRQHRFHGLFELESVSWHGGRHDAVDQRKDQASGIQEVSGTAAASQRENEH